MGWREWPSWVKGGILSVVVVVVLGILQGLFMFFLYGRCEEPLWTTCYGECPPRSTAACFVNKMFSLPLYMEPLSFIISGIQLIIWFLVGAAIGWIAGRIKGKKAVSVK